MAALLTDYWRSGVINHGRASYALKLLNNESDNTSVYHNATGLQARTVNCLPNIPMKVKKVSQCRSLF